MTANWEQCTCESELGANVVRASMMCTVCKCASLKVCKCASLKCASESESVKVCRCCQCASVQVCEFESVQVKVKV